MWLKSALITLCLAAGLHTPAAAQGFVETGTLYPLSTDGEKYAVNGFINTGLADEETYANALLWTIDNVCPRLLEGIEENSVGEKRFSCRLTLAPPADAEEKNLYHCRAIFQAAGGKLVYYLSDILIESSTFVMKKVTPMEKLSPEKKDAHKRTMEEFVRIESHLLNRMFDFVTTYRPAIPITHWLEIGNRRPIVGMTEDECRLAFGKPQAVTENNGEVQWMYSTAFYLFFKEGKVETIIK